MRSLKVGKQLKDNKAADDSSPLNSSGSSITEEIFNTALSNLEFLSDEEGCDGNADI